MHLQTRVCDASKRETKKGMIRVWNFQCSNLSLRCTLCISIYACRMLRFLSLSTNVPYDLTLKTTEDGMPLRVFWWRCSRHYAIFEFTFSWSIESKHEFSQLSPSSVDHIQVSPQSDTSLFLLSLNLAYNPLHKHI